MYQTSEVGAKKRFQVHTFLTAEEKATLVQYAEDQGLSQSAVIRQLILKAASEELAAS